MKDKHVAKLGQSPLGCAFFSLIKPSTIRALKYKCAHLLKRKTLRK